MNDAAATFLSAQDLRQILRDAAAEAVCDTCPALVCLGWESVPGSFERSRLRRVGTLRPGGDEEPTLYEHHPGGTHTWSANAPIAPAFFPYNRCDVWRCVTCARPFLRYTEYGGYYEDERIRELRSELVDEALP